MQTEVRTPEEERAAARRDLVAEPRRRRLITPAAWILGGLLLVALGLRLWSIRYGLPWIYNRDEEFHFVPVAVRMFGGSFNPHYFENPPALTYLLYAVFRLRFHSAGFRHAFEANPTAVYETARIVVALIGTASVGLVYWAGTRWFDRRVALLAAALIAFGFLPAFYGKFALNDAVTLAPAAVALAMIAIAWQRGRTWQWAAAGAAIGVATAVKYTAGAMLLPLAIAIVLWAWDAKAATAGSVAAGDDADGDRSVRGDGTDGGPVRSDGADGGPVRGDGADGSAGAEDSADRGPVRGDGAVGGPVRDDDADRGPVRGGRADAGGPSAGRPSFGAGLRSAAIPILRAGVAAGIAFGVAFFILNPYSVLDFATFKHQVANQSATAGGAAKLGQSNTPGWLYYLWTLTWGLGWIPAVAAVAGGVLLLRENWRRGLVLVVFPVFMFLFLGGQARHFGRWFMPAYPAIVLLAGYGAVRAADWIGRGRRWAAWALPAIAVLMLAQGLAATVRVDAVLARTDTRALARSWIFDNIPAKAGMVVEPFVPEGWLAQPNRAGPERYRLYPIKPPFQAYEKKLDASLIDRYRSHGYCWVVVASHQKQRGLEAKLPGAIGYYQRLNRESDQTQLFNPWRSDADRPGFNFDMSFDYYPTAFIRPGPLIEVHHLRGCKS